jgi:hypothetical protein
VNPVVIGIQWKAKGFTVSSTGENSVTLSVAIRVDMGFVIQWAKPTKHIALRGLEMPFDQQVVI